MRTCDGRRRQVLGWERLRAAGHRKHGAADKTRGREPWVRCVFSASIACGAYFIHVACVGRECAVHMHLRVALSPWAVIRRRIRNEGVGAYGGLPNGFMCLWWGGGGPGDLTESERRKACGGGEEGVEVLCNLCEGHGRFEVGARTKLSVQEFVLHHTRCVSCNLFYAKLNLWYGGYKYHWCLCHYFRERKHA
jgi:hypothetical protein